MSTSATRKLPVALLVIAAFIAGIFFVTSSGALFDGGLFGNAEAQQAPAVRGDVSQGIETATELGEAFAAVAEAVNPAVVSISTTQNVAQSEMGNPFEGTPFEQFFGGGGQGNGSQVIPRSALGSGAIVRPNGFIVTNNHVVENADEVLVHFFDGTELVGEIVGTDPFADLAVIKVDAEQLPYLGFGEAERLRVGQWVIAVGSPLQQSLSNTVTAGIISALGRSQQINQLENFIQTDASINPGNSGGPLVNLRGQLIGINTAIATRTGGFQGIGFAIPVDIVENVVGQLIETGEVERGFLGVSFGAISQSYARALDVPVGSAQVSSVQDGSAADDAGIEAGDVIVSVDGNELRNSSDLLSIVANRRPGDELRLTYLRGEDRLTTTVTLGARVEDEQAANRPRRDRKPSGDNGQKEMDVLGMTLGALTARQAEQFGYESNAEGVLVTGVERGTEAFRDANIREGDLIVSISGESVTSLADFERIYGRIGEGETFILTLQRAGQQGRQVYRTALTK
ncbi:MAG: Do family serine endopeptidase [Rhodothermales bacterium]